MKDPKVLRDCINLLTTEIEAREVERAKLLDEWAALVYPYKLGDHVYADSGRRVRITGIKGEFKLRFVHTPDKVLGVTEPCVAVSYQPVKKDGTDSLRYGGRFFWTPEGAQ